MKGSQLSLNGVGAHDAASRVGHAAFAAIIDRRQKEPDFKLTEDALVEAIRPALAVEFPVAARTKRVDGRDALFDAIANACGCDLNGLTREYARRVATAKRDITEATPDVTPEEVNRRASIYAVKYSGCALTPNALANRWPELKEATAAKREKGGASWL